MNKNYKVGDTIIYTTFSGERRQIVVTNKEEDIKNGYPGFEGSDKDGNDCWGYDDQIVDVYPKQ
jgi:hypothetical protein